MSTRDALLQLLADGAFHSGTALGERLGVSRAAIHKAIQHLVEDGIEIHRVTGRGYRLSEAFTPLDATAIAHALAGSGFTPRVEVLAATDSTSQHLLSRSAPEGSARVCLAEAQTAGRGRRGRGWVATPYRNIVMSMSWRFEGGPAALTGLSLAAGVAVLEALDAFGVTGVGLKWPNDILFGGRKLAGLLVDLRGEAAGPSFVVLGLGLNVAIAEREAAMIDQPWAALSEILPKPVDRNRLAALLIRHLVGMFRRFEREGFAAFRAEWERHHLFAGQAVRVETALETVSGTVEGIDEHGALCLRDTHGALRRFHSGEVSLRHATGARA